MSRSLDDATDDTAVAPSAAEGAGSAPAIRCRGLWKVYDRAVEAVRGLDLEVGCGECFGLLGPNGAGKTTTIEILEGLLEPTAGEVAVLGERWGRQEGRLRQRIGISLQETRLTEKLTVRETVRLFRSFYERGLDPDEVIERVSLTEKANAWVGKLSGGQRQRLAFACALVGDPELLFLDEPTTGLDPTSRREVWALVRDFQKRGRTVLITTHYMDEAERLCNRVAIVDHGRVIALGSPAELIAGLGGEHVIEFAVAPAGAAPGSSNGADRDSAAVVMPALESIPSVRSVRAQGAGISLTAGEPHRVIPAVLELVRGRELQIARLTTRHASLEDVFVNLTGRHLSDESADPLPSPA
jgi:ABC-2 type transport system ATP-binding protein